jgi:nucleoside phosphorylase
MRYIVTALISEAKPIIDFLKLQKIDDKKFPIFSNKETTLIISGMGKVNSAIATTYLSLKSSDTIINIGICGATNHKIGSLHKIKKIIDKNSQKVIHVSKEGESLICVETPQNNPNDFKNTLVDMESFGFFQAAKKFVNKENISIFKIVSDKISDTILTPQEVEKLIKPNLESIL